MVIVQHDQIKNFLSTSMQITTMYMLTYNVHKEWVWMTRLMLTNDTRTLISGITTSCTCHKQWWCTLLIYTSHAQYSYLINAIFNKSAHCYPKTTVRSNIPPHSVQRPWNGVAIYLFLCSRLLTSCCSRYLKYKIA